MSAGWAVTEPGHAAAIQVWCVDLALSGTPTLNASVGPQSTTVTRAD